MQHLCVRIATLSLCSLKMARLFLISCYHDLLYKTNTFTIYILYFLSLFFVGFGILKSLNPRTESRNIDLFFTSVSAATVSSMAAVEMEVFSNAQLIVMTVLMFLGGEIFTAMAMLHFNSLRKPSHDPPQLDSVSTESRYRANTSFDQIELQVVTIPDHSESIRSDDHDAYNSIKFLGLVVLVYLLVVQILGVTSLLIYLSYVSGANTLLKNKGLKVSTFAVFTIVSTFANCGFIPTNENLIVFSKNSGLLLILIPQILLGNTLFPPALRLVLTILGMKFNKSEANDLLKTNGDKLGFHHLLPRLPSLFLLATVLGFILISFVIFSAVDWNTVGLDGMNTYQKVVGIFFQCANARHAGENIVDISTLSAAVLVFFVVMMYLPPYTSFVPVDKQEAIPSKFEGKENKTSKIIENTVFSQLSYIAIFIVLICITERKSLKEDPLNFSLLNITIEVISAYGNVGLTTGYSCDRQIRKDPTCVSKWYGFVGKWSDEGKVILILVMFFGRLKQFHRNGGRAWKLS